VQQGRRGRGPLREVQPSAQQLRHYVQVKALFGGNGNDGRHFV